jgi:hypothetical protein
MPGRNGTGPNGDGPMTGRGFGPCGENESTSTRENRGETPYGHRWRAGRRGGFGHGHRHRHFADETFNYRPGDPDTEQEISSLREKIEKLERQIAEMKKQK